MTQTAATTDRDGRTHAPDPAEPLAKCQPCFCRVCGEPVIVWGWAP